MCQVDNITQLVRRFILLVPVILIIWTGTASAKNSGSLTNNCIECHDDIWDEEITKTVIHEPFLENDCLVCHSENPKLLVDDEFWTDMSLLPSTSHWFEFDANELPPTIILQASFGKKLCLSRVIPFPPLDELSELSDVYKQRSPEIFDVKVLEVARGIFLTASISWSTDRPTSSLIAYGVEGLWNTAPMGNLFHTEHLETLSGLEHDQTYQFRITAEDDFGNITESDIFIFDTFSTFSKSAQESANPSLTKALSLKSKFFRRNDQYLINLTSTQPFKVFLRLKNNFNIKTKEPDGQSRHIILAGEKISTFLVCKVCHPNSDHHPANVYPKRGMKVADDYPTMADGSISCISCHAPHASNLEFLLIKDKRQGLCVDCHSSHNNRVKT